MIVFDPSTQQYVEVPDPTSLPVPFLKQQIGAGDVVADITQALGIPSCSPCEERRKRWNQALTLKPWET